jgi:hypothetical protein
MCVRVVSFYGETLLNPHWEGLDPFSRRLDWDDILDVRIFVPDRRKPPVADFGGSLDCGVAEHIRRSSLPRWREGDQPMSESVSQIYVVDDDVCQSAEPASVAS